MENDSQFGLIQKRLISENAVKKYDVVGLGNALMDLLAEVSEEKINEYELIKGEFNQVEAERKQKIIQEMILSGVEKVPGGSVANTLKGMALLGSKVIFYAGIGQDELGNSYEKALENYGVITRLHRDLNLSTGHCLAFITPDSERTMITYLGAAKSLSTEHLQEEDIANSKILFLEGYQLEGETKETVLQAINFAKKHQTLVAIDLADPGLIRRNKPFLENLLKTQIDLVFVNENEAKELTGFSGEKSGQELAKSVNIAVIKLGAQGSLIYHQGKKIKIPPYFARAIDTTGAGDTYAAGFLYGYCQGWELERTGKLGSLLAAKIVEQIGVRTDKINVQELKQKIIDEQ